MPQLTAERAEEILARMRGQSVLVFGDVMLDEFIWGSVTRISPEAPVPVVDINRESVHLGGAANVLANLIAMGVQANVVGVIGNDRAGKRLRAEARAAGVQRTDHSLIEEAERPTTIKSRIVAHNQLVVRADRESRAPVNSETEKQLITVLRELINEVDAFVVSDYDKGVVTPNILAEILPLAYAKGMPVLVDPKIRNFSKYRPATLVTPNHHEALSLMRLMGVTDQTGAELDNDAGLEQAGRMIREQLCCDSVLITRGENGMMLFEGDGAPVHVKTLAHEVYDVTGAGDTVIATLAAALSANATTLEAAILANHAAGVVVGKIGTSTVSIEEIKTSILAGSEGLIERPESLSLPS